MKYKAGALLLEWFIENDCEGIYKWEGCGVQKDGKRAGEIVVEGNKKCQKKLINKQSNYVSIFTEQ